MWVLFGSSSVYPKGCMSVSGRWKSPPGIQEAVCPCRENDLLPSSALHLWSQSRHSQGGQRRGEQELAGQIWDARGLFQFGKIKSSAICCLITQATSVRLVVVLVLEEPYCEMFSFHQISQPPGPTSFSLPDDWDNRTSYLHSPFSTGRSCIPLHGLYWLSSSWSLLLLFWGLE